MAFFPTLAYTYAVTTLKDAATSISTQQEHTLDHTRSIFFPISVTTRPFRYDPNQIPYYYAVEVTNRFKGLDLIDRAPEESWMEVHDIIQDVVIKTVPKKKKCKKAKWLSEEVLQIAEK